MRTLLLLTTAGCSQVVPGPLPIDPDGSEPTAPVETATDGSVVSPAPFGCEAPAALGPDRLASAFGPLQGRSDGDTVTFQGVPYAAPPVGALRFAPPEPPACWSEPVEATAPGPICPQPLPLGVVAAQSEDCLSLNVWTPALDGGSRPVLVFVHGGANALGSAQDGFGMYDGRRLAEAEDVVVVTLQYRLGALGFLAHPGLRGEGRPSGNQGLLDQQLALRWVAEHAAALGGDPDRVMLFGESAGAWNTCMHLAAPGSAGLFSAALMESGSCAVRDLAGAERDGLAAAAEVGCSATLDPAGSLACLREQPALELALLVGETGFDDSWKYLRWGPVVDGEVLPEDPIAAFEAGRHPGVPVVVGSNEQEGELFTPPLLTCLDASLFVELSFGSLAPVIHDLYPCDEALFARWAVVDAVTDASFTCHARRVLGALHAGGAPVHRYVYGYTRADPLLIALRAFHSAELPLVFGTHDRLGYVPPPGEDALSAELMGMWAGLARDGDPGLPAWDPGADVAGWLDADLFGARIEPVAGFRGEQCDALDPFLF